MRCLSLDELADLLRAKSPRAFRARLPGLQKRHGFPRPLPGLVPLTWSAAAVEDWIAGRSAPAVPANDDKPPPDPVTAQRRALEERYVRP